MLLVCAYVVHLSALCLPIFLFHFHFRFHFHLVSSRQACSCYFFYTFFSFLFFFLIFFQFTHSSFGFTCTHSFRSRIIYEMKAIKMGNRWKRETVPGHMYQTHFWRRLLNGQRCWMIVVWSSKTISSFEFELNKKKQREMRWMFCVSRPSTVGTFHLISFFFSFVRPFSMFCEIRNRTANCWEKLIWWVRGVRVHVCVHKCLCVLLCHTISFLSVNTYMHARTYAQRTVN